MILRDKKLWICAGIYAVVVVILVQISAWGDPYDPAPYRVLLELITPLVWLGGIYRRWSGRWQQDDNGAWVGLLVITTLPHIPMTMIAAGPWFCLGGSVLVGVLMILWNKKVG